MLTIRAAAQRKSSTMTSRDTGRGREKTVLVYKSMLLPASETFIKEQILAYRRWRGVLMGRSLLRQLPLDGLDVRLLRPERPSYLDRAGWTLCRAFDVVPPWVVRRMRKESASLVHAHFGPDGVEIWPLARALGLPLLITLHGYDVSTHKEWWERGNTDPTLRRYPRRLLDLSAEPLVRFIAVSHSLCRRAIEFGIPAEKISVQHIGVDPKKFVPGRVPISERARRVLFVGRLVEKKGCHYVIEAMAQVQKAVPEARLAIVGDGPLRTGLETLSRELGVRAEFHGARSSDEIRREFDRARVFCLPSLTARNGDAEGLPITILEAQAAGLPVVVSDHGGAKEAIREGVTGYSFPEGHSGALAERLITTLTDDHRATAMGKAAVGHVARSFDIGNCTDALERCYDETSRTALMGESFAGLSMAPR
jgi:glycosyltransferase involved in cell wall biosynthesis